jgi:beta-glucosidase
LRKFLFRILLFIILITLSSNPLTAKKPLYKNENAPVNRRIDDLLKRMTLEEKVAQMCQYVGIEHLEKSENYLSREELENSDAHGMYAGLHSSEVEKMVEDGLIGSFLHIKDAAEANRLQKLAQKSRLQIPLLFGIDAIHGNAMQKGTTVYPTPITQASTWDRDLVEKIARETAVEMRAAGMHWTFTPNVDVARDARWGRVGETFGEDPYLVSEMGVAAVKGFQQDNFTGDEQVLACAKHFIAGSEPVNGLNFAPMDVSERTLREVFLPPYQKAIEEGVFTLMAAHNEINGIPCHADQWLMTDLLRGEMGFEGFVVSDWTDVERLHTSHKVAKSRKEACYQTVVAGLDMHMHGPDFLEPVMELVKAGRISEERIDQSVRKILEAKFRLGLFENPLVDLENYDQKVLTDDHQKTALEAARKGIVLLKNEDILPLNKNKYKNIFVTGPNANNQRIIGDWAALQPEDNITTLHDGIKKHAPKNYKVSYLDCGEDFKNIKTSDIRKARKMAKKADVAIVVVGENSLRSDWTTKTCGENMARANIKLVGKQLNLIKSIHKSGKPVIVVLVNGRPLSTTWIAKHIPVLIEAWEPGAKGGQALAEIIFGNINPSGKLPVTIPRNVGQIQMIYNHKPTQYFREYYEEPVEPLFPFGFGLSYTTFEYSDIRLKPNRINKNENTSLVIKVKNTGKIAGDEIVQLYIRDMYSSVTRPVKELKGFRRIHLKPGQTKSVKFKITPEKLSFYNAAMQKVVEPGKFLIMAGCSSRDQDLKKVELEVLD